MSMTLLGENHLPPFGAIPSPRQLAWHDQDYYAFIHFGPNTFTAKEWGDGREKPEIFLPTQLDTDQWCKTFRDAGMSGVIITAKHHDGFCLWPSKYSTHTVAQSSWMGGKGDVLKLLAESCRKFGLKMGVYLSPWDRNHPLYGTPGYNQVFANMLQEVLTQYGPIFEVWFDGANGEGPNGKKQVYDWNLFNQTVRKYQPNAVIFSDAGPDIRWVGNEAGHSAPTCWATINRDRYVPGTPYSSELTEGIAGGSHWVPAECDVSIRKGWFWKESENNTVKSADKLMSIYLQSVGQNASLLLNVPPDRRGLIHEKDVEALMAFKEAREAFFDQEISQEATYSASHTRGRSDRFSADHLKNGEGYWAVDDDVKRASITLTWQEPVTFDSIVLAEPIQFGQRISAFRITAEDGQGNENEIAVGTTIGDMRIIPLDKPVTAQKIEILILDSLAPPALELVQVFRSRG